MRGVHGGEDKDDRAVSYAEYLHCPGCDGKTIYIGDFDESSLVEGVVAWHETCLRDRMTTVASEAAAAAGHERGEAPDKTDWPRFDCVLCGAAVQHNPEWGWAWLRLCYRDLNAVSQDRLMVLSQVQREPACEDPAGARGFSIAGSGRLSARWACARKAGRE